MATSLPDDRDDDRYRVAYKSAQASHPGRRDVVLGATAAVGALLVRPSAAFITTAHAAVPVVLQTEEIAPGVFVARGVHAVMSGDNGGHIANLGFVVGRERVAVIDTGGSFKVGMALLEAIRARTALPVGVVINTHMHPDHVLGNAAFEGAPSAGSKSAAPGSTGPAVEFIAHHKMARGLSARAERYLEHNGAAIGAGFEGTRVVLPTRTVDTAAEIDLGGRTLLLQAHATAHTDNDLTVRDLETNTLFAGDLLFSGHIPTIDGSLRGWLKVLDQLVKQPVARVVPGHGPATMTWPDAVEPQRRYFEMLTSNIRALIKQGRSLEDTLYAAARDNLVGWELSQEYHKRNVAAAFAELEWE